jgi:hypothetical protein
MSRQIRIDRFHRKPWRASWTIPELEHRKFSKANMGDGNYDEEFNSKNIQTNFQ